MTLWAAMAEQHNAVEEPLCFLNKELYSFCHIERNGYDVH